MGRWSRGLKKIIGLFPIRFGDPVEIYLDFLQKRLELSRAPGLWLLYDIVDLTCF